METQKREHDVHAHFRKNQKEIHSTSRKVWWLDNSKVLNEGRESRNNHLYAIVVQILATPWNPCETKTSQETEKNLRKFLEPSQKPKVIHTDDSLECEELSWNHCTSTPHRSETNEIAERAVRRVKEGTSAVLWWRIDWNATSICETGGSEYHLTDQGYRLEQWSNSTLFSAKDPSRLHQFGPKVFPYVFLRCA